MIDSRRRHRRTPAIRRRRRIRQKKKKKRKKKGSPKNKYPEVANQTHPSAVSSTGSPRVKHPKTLLSIALLSVSCWLPGGPRPTEGGVTLLKRGGRNTYYDDYHQTSASASIHRFPPDSLASPPPCDRTCMDLDGSSRPRAVIPHLYLDSSRVVPSFHTVFWGAAPSPTIFPSLLAHPRRRLMRPLPWAFVPSSRSLELCSRWSKI